MQNAGGTGTWPSKADPAAGGHHSPQAEVSLISRWLCLFVFATTMLGACATSHHSSQGSAAPLAQTEEHHIYVTSADLNGGCYKDLGQVTLSESFAQSVVEDSTAQAQRLRELAQEKYASQVDAVINVRQNQNDVGTAVEITGEAVHIENHQTVACTARAMPAVVDSASAAAAGGIVGTVIGGLASGSTYGAEAGGATGASAVAGIELAKHRQQQQAKEAFIGDRLKQQQNEIERLYEQLAKLIEQQCDTEELSQQDCNERIAAVQQQIAKVPESDEKPESEGRSGTSANGSGMTEFQIRNHVQEQQEIINQLQQQIAQIKQKTNAQ